MKTLHPYKFSLILTFLLFFSSIHAQTAIYDKVNENLTAIEAVDIRTPLIEVMPDVDPIALSTLSEKQLFEIDQTALRSIQKNKSPYLRVALPIAGQLTELQLFKADIFTPSFKAVASSNPNKELDIKHGAHYWGIIAGTQKSLVSLSFFDGEIFGLISYNGAKRTLGKIDDSDYHVMYEANDFNHELSFSCEVLEVDGKKANTDIDTNQKSNALLACVGIHLEVDYSLYQSKGSNVTTTTNYVTGLFGQMAILYANESISIAISYLNVWNTPSPFGAGTELDDLTNQGFGTTNGNLVHLLHTNSGGGVAYLDQLCSNFANTGVSGIFGSYNNVPTYSWDAEVFTHEIGHNLGSPHTHACAWNGNNTAIDGCGPAAGYDEGCNPGLPASGTIMSYCHLVGSVGIDFNLGFGQQPGDLIRNRVANANCQNFCTVVCPAQVSTPYTRTEDVCAGINTYTLPTTYTGLVIDNATNAVYEWSTGNYISAGGTAFNGTTYTLNNPNGCNPVTERLYLNAGCTTGGLNDINAGILTLNVYPDPAQFTAADLVSVSGENTCGEPVFTTNCAGVTVTPDPTNPSFPVGNGQNGTANYTVTYTPQAGAPDCCNIDTGGSELITNGDFEAGAAGWTETEEVPSGTPNPNPFGIIGVSNGQINGSNEAWFGGWGGTSTLTISQNITIPPTCGQANLTFDFAMSCAGDAGITLGVAVNGVVLGTLACTDASAGSITAFDLIAAGAPTGNVTISFIGTEDGTGTGEPDIYIDNVSVVTANCSVATVCEIPVSASYDCAGAVCASVDLDIQFDGFPTQTSWEIVDASGTVVASSGGTYSGSNANSSTTESTCLFDGCYTLNFNDALGNGMCPFRATASSLGTFITPGTIITPGSVVATLGTVVAPGLCGNFSLSDAGGTTLVTGGGSFGSSTSQQFCLTGGLGRVSNKGDSNKKYMGQNESMMFNVFPTFVNDGLNVSYSLEEVDRVQLNIVNINGQVIQQHLNEGSANTIQLNVSDIPAGVYFVHMVVNDIILVEKFVKQ